MEENWQNWEFMIDGDPHLLRGLTDKIGTRYFSVSGGVDNYHDCQNDDFRMKTLYAQDETDPYVVWQVGQELMNLLNGAFAVYNMGVQKFSIHNLLYQERTVSQQQVQVYMGLLGKPQFPQARLDKELGHARKLFMEFVLLHLATENQDVYFILKYLNMEPGWVPYYALMESIEESAKAKGIALATNTATQKSFTNTANNFSLSGFDARHGFKQVVKANKTPSMTLEDGHRFVTSMVKEYIEKAYGLKSAK